jgi:hypothetical protein
LFFLKLVIWSTKDWRMEMMISVFSAGDAIIAGLLSMIVEAQHNNTADPAIQHVYVILNGVGELQRDAPRPR